MIIVCPECGLKYTVGNAAIKPPGRKVRCASCGHQWHQQADSGEFFSGDESLEVVEDAATAPPNEPPPEDESLVARRFPADAGIPPAPTGKGNEKQPSLALTAVLLLLPLAALAGGLIGLRPALEKTWPPVVRLYRMARLEAPPAGTGLEFHDMHAALRNEDGGKTLTIDGTITDPKGKKTRMPPLDATMVVQGKTVREWIFDSGVSTVSSRQPAKFFAVLDAKDIQTGNLLLSFSQEDTDIER